MTAFQKRTRRGFTLIELLVVISIISLMSSIALASLNAAREKARIAKAKQEVATLYQAILRYYTDNGTWPEGPTNGNFWTTSEWNASWKAGYLDGGVPDDPWGNYYVYDGRPDIECSAGSSAICSPGKNGLYESWNRPDMTPQNDDICIYFEPQC